MSDGYAPVKGKCVYWRERLNEEDRWDVRLREDEKRVECSCFVEGDIWSVTTSTIPNDCPNRWHCRYYIRGT